MFRLFEDSLMWIMAVIMAIMVVVLVFVALPKQLERNGRADQLAARANCVNLGHARDMNTVFFFDCSGEIRLVRVVNE